MFGSFTIQSHGILSVEVVQSWHVLWFFIVQLDWMLMFPLFSFIYSVLRLLLFNLSMAELNPKLSFEDASLFCLLLLFIVHHMNPVLHCQIQMQQRCWKRCVCVCVFQCFDLDKFEGVSSESVLVEQSFKLLNQDRFWAGLVFTDLYDTSDLQPPPHIRYKIRMEIEETERTDKIKERLEQKTLYNNTITIRQLKKHEKKKLRGSLYEMKFLLFICMEIYIFAQTGGITYTIQLIHIFTYIRSKN